jgi:hypothetical protein
VPSDPRRDEFVDRGIDCCVLATNTGPGEEACDEEVPRREGERGRDGGYQVDREREYEELLAPEPVGELAEEQGAQACASDVDGGGDADLGGTEFDAAAVLGQARCDIADHCDFEAVEDPDAAQSNDDAPVKPRPWQAVQRGYGS